MTNPKHPRRPRGLRELNVGLPQTMVDTPEALSRTCAELAEETLIGFDTEFIGEDRHRPDLCLIQAATAKHLYLIDPLTVGPLDSFWQLLIDPNRTVVVHAGREEIRLCEQHIGHPPAKVFDVQIAAGLVGLAFPLGHSALIQQVLNLSVPKNETLTDWRRRPLTAQQIEYAYDDVRYLLPLYRLLSSRLSKLGRLDWVYQECAELCVRSIKDPPELERWRRLRGASSLDRQRLGVLRALFAWREEQAAQVNRPARTILRDDLLVELAKRNPQRPRDLQVLRGLPKLDFDQLYAIIQQARDLPADLQPELMETEADPPQFALIASVLQAVLTDLCQRHKLAQSLVATAADIRQLLRVQLTNAPPGDLPLLRGWRAEAVLPELLAILRGQRAIYIRDSSSANPLGYVDRLAQATTTHEPPPPACVSPASAPPASAALAPSESADSPQPR